MTIVARMTERLLRRGLPGLAALLFGVAVFELIQPIVAESLGGPEGLMSLVEALPPAFQALLQTRPEVLSVSGLAGYLSLGFTHPLYLVLASTTVIVFTCQSLAGEMERGTIQLALARPVSRPRVYSARVLGLAMVTTALAVIGPLGMIVGLAIARPEGDLTYRNLAPAAIATALLFWSIGGLTLLGSATASTTGRAVAWATAALAIFYFVDYFAALWDFLTPATPLTIFHYYDPALALVDGTLPLQNALTLGLVGLFGVLGGLVVFVRRDLPT